MMKRGVNGSRTSIEPPIGALGFDRPAHAMAAVESPGDWPETVGSTYDREMTLSCPARPAVTRHGAARGGPGRDAPRRRAAGPHQWPIRSWRTHARGRPDPGADRLSEQVVATAVHEQELTRVEAPQRDMLQRDGVLGIDRDYGVLANLMACRHQGAEILEHVIAEYDRIATPEVRHGVMAGAAAERKHVATAVTGQHVISVTAEEKVVAVAAMKRVLAGASRQTIIANVAP